MPTAITVAMAPIAVTARPMRSRTAKPIGWRRNSTTKPAAICRRPTSPKATPTRKSGEATMSSRLDTERASTRSGRLPQLGGVFAQVRSKGPPRPAEQLICSGAAAAPQGAAREVVPVLGDCADACRREPLRLEHTLGLREADIDVAHGFAQLGGEEARNRPEVGFLRAGKVARGPVGGGGPDPLGDDRTRVDRVQPGDRRLAERADDPPAAAVAP